MHDSVTNPARLRNQGCPRDDLGVSPTPVGQPSHDPVGLPVGSGASELTDLSVPKSGQAVGRGRLRIALLSRLPGAYGYGCRRPTTTARWARDRLTSLIRQSAYVSDDSEPALGGERVIRPVTAAQLFNTPEMGLRYPAEVEVRRDGANEGEGRGFDNIDLSAAAERWIATSDAAATAVAWFAEQLIARGWKDGGDGWFGRDEGESFLVRIDRDRGLSRVGSEISDSHHRRIQQDFEAVFYAGAPPGWSVVTLSFIVAPGPDHVRQ